MTAGPARSADPALPAGPAASADPATTDGSADPPGASTAAGSAATAGSNAAAGPNAAAGSHPPARSTRTRAAGTALTAGLLLLLLGVLAGRPDVALVALGPVAAAGWDLARRPRTQLAAEVRRDGDGAGTAAPDLTGALGATLRLEAPAGAAAVRVRVVRRGSPTTFALVRVDGRRDLGVTVRTVRTGPQELVQTDLQVVGAGFATVAEPVAVPPRHLVVLPRAVPLGRLPLPFRLRGSTGAHVSRRVGDGGDLHDVHAFATGDRLRRIDWRVTARRSPDLTELYVRRTTALADAAVMLVVDSRDDVGPDPGTWSGARPVRPQEATSLDLARQAAMSIARQLIAAGDRVGLDDLGVRRRPIAPGGGRRQYDRIVHTLALTHPDGPATGRVRPPRFAAGSLVVVLSTFLDGGAAQAARTWRRSGHRVIAVDILPQLRVRGLTPREQLALRIVQVERVDRLAALAATGVEIVRWSTGRPEIDLARLARSGERQPGAGVLG